jgi:pyruvate kinase
VLIDDGLVRLRVDGGGGRARCAFVVGGDVSSHKGVNLPGVPLPIPSLTRKDMDDLDWALETASTSSRSPSSARRPTCATCARSRAGGSHAHVIAKIEKAEAVDVLDDDPRRDGRGDGRARRPRVEIGRRVVPLVQKRIIHARSSAGSR